MSNYICDSIKASNVYLHNKGRDSCVINLFSYQCILFYVNGMYTDSLTTVNYVSTNSSVLWKNQEYQ